ncbi:hypothetical protein [Zobellella sp. An-6]|uniref:hypothetical protein n=1 Tax=Zobellella sp. An-6 TaxID=3400218 RepID=UPI004040F64A
MQRQRVWLLRAVIVACVTAWAGPATAAESLDGITIIEFTGGHDVLPGGDHIVTFISSRGSYAAVTTTSQRGCLAAAVPGSYTGKSITFGVEASMEARRIGVNTLCPKFTLTLEGDDVRVEAAPLYGHHKPALKRRESASDYSRRHAIIAQAPLVSVDFGASHFRRHEVKGVQLGPVLDQEDIGPLPRTNSPNGYIYRYFQRNVGVEAGKPRNVQGYVAPAEITGWPWDVLYSARYYRQYEAPVMLSSFKDVLFEQYGLPSAETADDMQWYWVYDLDGVLIKPGERSDPCSNTLGYWLKQNREGRVTSLTVSSNPLDLGAWGCSLLMDINARSNPGVVDHYSVNMVSGYAMAMSHFFQRIEEAQVVQGKFDELQSFKPDLN